MNLIRETKTICLNQTKIIMHHFTHKHSGSGGSNVVEETASKSKGLPSIPPVARAFFSSSVFKCSVLNEVPPERSIFVVLLFPLITLAVLPEAKQA